MGGGIYRISLQADMNPNTDFNPTITEVRDP